MHWKTVEPLVDRCVANFELININLTQLARDSMPLRLKDRYCDIGRKSMSGNAFCVWQIVMNDFGMNCLAWITVR